MTPVEIKVGGKKNGTSPTINSNTLPPAFDGLSVAMYEVKANKTYDREKQIGIHFQPGSWAMDPLVVILLTQATLNFYGEIYKFTGIRTEVEYGYYEEAEAVVVFQYTAI